MERIMTAAMFAALTDAERRELAGRLRRAGHRFGEEASMLAAAPSSVLACYHLPREGCHDFYAAAIESSLLSVEARGYEGYGASVHDWDAEAAEREQYADVMADDLADQRRMDRSGLAGRSTPRREAATQAGTPCTPRPAFAPTGTGWPVT